jgi:hypothetical protein
MLFLVDSSWFLSYFFLLVFLFIKVFSLIIINLDFIPPQMSPYVGNKGEIRVKIDLLLTKETK